LQSPRPNNLFIGLYFPVFRRVKFVDGQKIICFLNRQCVCEKIPLLFPARDLSCRQGWRSGPVHAQPGLCPRGRGG